MISFSNINLSLSMTRLTVDINSKKSEKAVKAILEALGLNYELEQQPD
jgi:hypothetical protein